jgi:AraC-like DNA-binding protein
LLDASGLGQWRTLRVGAVHEVTENFHALGREARGEGALGHALCETLARFLLLKVQQNSVPGARSVPRSFMTYERLRRHIEAHYRRLRTVEELALECGVTQVHVSRLFQRFAQTGAYQFLLRLKMNDAAELLDNGLLVKEVAERLGFADAFQFSRAFKRVQGVSPTRFQATRLSELFFDVVKKRVRA